MGIDDRIGIASPGFVTTPVGELLEHISKDFKVWEITSEYKHYLPAIEVELVRLLPSYNVKLQVHAPFADINIASLNDEMKRASMRSIERVIESARKLNIEIVTVHPGFYSPISFVNKEEAKRRNMASIVRLGKLAREHSLLLALENMPAIQWVILETADDIARALDEAKIGMCYDLGHANTTGRTEDMLRLNEKFVNVHVHDNTGERDAHLPVGKGRADVRRSVSALHDYKGNFILEVRDFHDALESRRAFAKLFKETFE